jgi:uncharacterized protein (UPF0333 family)
MIDVQLKGGDRGNIVQVNNDGELIVGRKKRDKFYNAATATNNVAVNVVEPKSGQKFIITGIYIDGDRSIGANGAVTDIFENTTGPTNATVNTQILQVEVPKQDDRAYPGLNIEVAEGSWVNIKSDDVIVRVNIAGFYEDA